MVDDVIGILTFFWEWPSFLANRATKRVHTMPISVFSSCS